MLGITASHQMSSVSTISVEINLRFIRPLQVVTYDQHGEERNRCINMQVKEPDPIVSNSLLQGGSFQNLADPFLGDILSLSRCNASRQSGPG